MMSNLGLSLLVACTLLTGRIALAQGSQKPGTQPPITEAIPPIPDAAQIMGQTGEVLETANGAPALVKFIHAEAPKDSASTSATKPLVVLIPGAGHTARVFYGVKPEAQDQDFVAYWLVRRGFNVLAISYPTQTKRSFESKTVPEFSVQDWGHQAADIARKFVTEQGLSKHVVLIAWSMGGRVVQPFTQAARADGLTVDLFISLSASPGIYRHVPPMNVEMAPSGYAQVKGMNAVFVEQLKFQNRLNGHTVISPDSYVNDYLGDTPVGLTGWGKRYSATGFVDGSWIDADDARAYDYDSLPIMASITNGSVCGPTVLDIVHALADQANWGFLLTNKLVADVRRAQPNPSWVGAQPERWRELNALIHDAPAQLAFSVEGDHLFFVGEKGAKQTADVVVTLVDRAASINAKLTSLLNDTSR
jgi:pimeloyl-ACP methyl ester carboxylesterase